MPTPNVIYGGPPALPGSCFLCNSAERERFIDWAVQVEFHGAFYLCDLCIIEAARAIGMLTEEQSEVLNLKYLNAQEQVKNTQDELSAVKRLVDGMDAVSRYLNDDSVSRESDSSSTEGTQESEGGVAEREEGPAESSTDENVGELRSADDSRPERVVSL